MQFNNGWRIVVAGTVDDYADVSVANNDCVDVYPFNNEAWFRVSAEDFVLLLVMIKKWKKDMPIQIADRAIRRFIYES
jgi:hypothetical protein